MRKKIYDIEQDEKKVWNEEETDWKILKKSHFILLMKPIWHYMDPELIFVSVEAKTTLISTN